MKDIKDIESFIPKDIDCIEERIAMWSYNVYAFTERWELVLESKWMLLAISQGRIQSEVTKRD